MNKNGTILWLTGLPCSGKTTISNELTKELLAQNVLVYSLDGDKIREGLNSDLGFSAEDRRENIRRFGEVAKLFMDAGFLVIVSVISPFKVERDKIKISVGTNKFKEIYVECPLDVCESRDVKGHYKKARAGLIEDFTGISAPYEPPLNPDIHLRTDIESIECCVKKIVVSLIELDYVKKDSHSYMYTYLSPDG